METLLTVLFACLSGIRRPFHYCDEHDVGLGLLTGRWKIMHGSTLSNRLRTINWRTINQVMRASRPLAGSGKLLMAIDEHVVARFTQLVNIGKTHHPTRNALLRADKLFYVFDVTRQRFLDLLVEPAGKALSQVAPALCRRARKNYKNVEIQVLLDAGAYGRKCIRSLIRIKGLSFVLRAKAYASNLKQWDKIDLTQCVDYIRPHERGKSSPKIYKLADIYTKITGVAEPIRTLLVIDPEVSVGGKGKRYFSLITTDTETPAAELVDQYRFRWRQETSYRVGKHDLYFDVLPQSYVVKKGPQPNPEREEDRILLVAWLKGVAFNVLRDFADRLPEKYHRLWAGTLLRKFILRPAELHLTDESLIVQLSYFPEQEALEEYLAWLNDQAIAIPWLKNRTLHVTLGSAVPAAKAIPRHMRKSVSSREAV